MLFTYIFKVFEIDMGGEERKRAKDSEEYNKKTLRFMGFIENEDGEWVKKGIVIPQKGVSNSE